MRHLGLTVYLWDSRDQNQLLADTLLPLSRELRGDGLLERLWFNRFDARGPHVFAVFSGPEIHAGAARDRIAAAVERHLAEHPAGQAATPVSATELERRHLECRGRSQSAADRKPGMAADRTWLLFDHGSRDYPFFLTGDSPAHDEIWRRIDAVTDWALQTVRAGGSPFGPAVRWAAELDEGLGGRTERAAYWRYHATTLLLPLRERLEKEPAEVEAALPSWIGEKNGTQLERLWSPGGLPAGTAEALRDLLEIFLPLPDRARWGLLREINHSLFNQLGMFTALEIPVILFGWNRNLR